MRRSSDRKSRTTEREDGWYFLTQEGAQGPYESEDAAKLALSEYILNVQFRYSQEGQEPDER